MTPRYVAPRYVAIQSLNTRASRWVWLEQPMWCIHPQRVERLAPLAEGGYTTGRWTAGTFRCLFGPPWKRRKLVIFPRPIMASGSKAVNLRGLVLANTKKKGSQGNTTIHVGSFSKKSKSSMFTQLPLKDTNRPIARRLGGWNYEYHPCVLYCILVGGWTNPLRKHMNQMGNHFLK